MKRRSGDVGKTNRQGDSVFFPSSDWWKAIHGGFIKWEEEGVSNCFQDKLMDGPHWRRRTRISFFRGTRKPKPGFPFIHFPCSKNLIYMSVIFNGCILFVLCSGYRIWGHLRDFLQKWLYSLEGGCLVKRRSCQFQSWLEAYNNTQRLVLNP